MRHTSVEVYRQIRNEGLLSELRLEVYETVFNHGPITQGETWMKLHRPRPSVTPRFAELQKRGVLKIVGERECASTGRKAVLWDVTDSLPVEPKKELWVKCSHCCGKGKLRLEEFVKLDHRHQMNLFPPAEGVL